MYLDLQLLRRSPVLSLKGGTIFLASWGVHRFQGVHMCERALHRAVGIVPRGSGQNSEAEMRPRTHILSGFRGRLGGQGQGWGFWNNLGGRGSGLGLSWVEQTGYICPLLLPGVSPLLSPPIQGLRALAWEQRSSGERLRGVGWPGFHFCHLRCSV